MLHFLYPSDPLRTKRPDEFYAEEMAAVRASGFDASVFSLEEFQAGSFQATPALPTATVIYRGWMLSASDYGALAASILERSAQPLTDLPTYLATHHLPNWYPSLADFTPETRIFPPTADLSSKLRSLNWPEYFIKDYVKSLKTSIGSRISSPEDAAKVATEMTRFRGGIEGGFCVRRVEEFLSEPNSDFSSSIRFLSLRLERFRLSFSSARAASIVASFPWT